MPAGCDADCMRDYSAAMARATAQAAEIDRLSDHEVAVRDTRDLIETVMRARGIRGTVTIDNHAPPETNPNTIQGAARDGSGGPGIADIILKTTDKRVYIWEVKSRGGKTQINGEWIPNAEAGRKQLQRYVVKLQQQLGKDYKVQRGFGLPTRVIPRPGGKQLRIWSGKDFPPKGHNSEMGLRFYNSEKNRKQEQEQEQEQEQPAPQPAPCSGVMLASTAFAASPCGDLPYPFFPFPEWPIPLPEFPVPVPVPI
jgi:hypothetical protein